MPEEGWRIGEANIVKLIRTTRSVHPNCTLNVVMVVMVAVPAFKPS